MGEFRGFSRESLVTRLGELVRGILAPALVLIGLAAGAGALPGCASDGGAQPAEPIDAKGDLAVDLGNGVTMDLVLVRPGTFMMGTDGGGDEAPRHEVTISRPFYLGKYEVTQEQWQAVMGTNPSKIKGPKNPVEQVSWEDCQGFLAKLSEQVAGPAFRLPTEAEWEYACRAGSEGRYVFGDAVVLVPDYAWCSENSESKTHPVGEKKPNAWGLYDITGNVWEWCADWYENGYYAKSPPQDPTGASSGSSRTVRGGGWGYTPDHERCACRGFNTPALRYSGYGLRVARGLP